MSTCDISKYEWSISIIEHFMTKFHELPEQPSYVQVYPKKRRNKKKKKRIQYSLQNYNQLRIVDKIFFSDISCFFCLFFCCCCFFVCFVVVVVVVVVVVFVLFFVSYRQIFRLTILHAKCVLL